MARDVSAYLLDILDACHAVQDLLAEVDLEAYEQRRSVRSAVEREFMLIGEAISRIGKVDFSMFALITNARMIVDFRNLLAHDYGAIDNETVFSLAQADLPILLAEVMTLLEQQGGKA